MKIVLASSSPRRKELLQTAGMDFEIDVEGVDEVPQGNTPEEKVCSIAAQKCRPVAARRFDDCVIGADTVVSVDGDILGKPHDREDAKNMLRRLSGREHTVYTGVCISAHGKETVFSEATKVKFFELTDKEIADYVLSGEPMDKAGAYGIQGLDRVPMDYMDAHGIKVFNARGVYSAPMAEFAVCSVLGFYKRSAFFSAAQSEHRWEKHRGLEELGGKRVVIVGAGSVGRACADRFRAFGCEIIGVDRRTAVDGFDKIYSIGDIRAAVSAGDIVIFCLPLTKETEHIANAELLCAMKDGAVIVNISRGGIIDTDALITELKSGRLRAALDVFEQEPLDAGSELWDLPNAVITPHNSFVGDGNRARLFSLIISNLK